MLAAVSFPIYVKALWNVLCGKDEAWSVTGRAGRVSSPFNVIVPQVLFWVFLSLTSVVAIARDVDNGVLTLATCWNLVNTAILTAFVVVAFREHHALRRGGRSGGRRAQARRRASVVAPAAAPTRTVVARPLPRTTDVEGASR